MSVMADKQLNDRFNELNERLDRQFGQIDERFERIEQTFSDQFVKMYVYMNKRFDDIEIKLETKADKTQVDRLQSSIDSFAQGQAKDELERHALATKVDRHDGWIKTLARKTQTKLG